MRIKNGLLHRSRRDVRGSIAIIFAFSILILGMVTGLAIDGSRIYNLSSRMAAALDAAALAAAKLMDAGTATDAEVQSMAEAYFRAHTSEIGIVGFAYRDLTVVLNRGSSSVAMTVDVSMPTTFGQLAGVSKLEFTKSTTVIFGTRPIELAMVLDVTGSMNEDGKISELKTAAKEVVETLLGSGAPTSKSRVALAPYSAAVNAGALAAAVSGGASVDNCVFERHGSHAYTEDAPGPGRYLGSMPNPFRPTNGNYGCPHSVILPLTNDGNLLKRTIGSYRASGFTAGHIGTAWGWYLLSPSWSSLWPSGSAPASYSTTEVIKAVILMTDGEFNTSYYNGPSNTTSADQARRLCANIKAAGITIYAVAFNSPPAAAALLKECATAPDKFFSAVDGGQLRAAFASFAGDLLNKSLQVAK